MNDSHTSWTSSRGPATSPSALAGAGEEDAAALEKAFDIKTVRQVGSNKFFSVAAALVALEQIG